MGKDLWAHHAFSVDYSGNLERIAHCFGNLLTNWAGVHLSLWHFLLLLAVGGVGDWENSLEIEEHTT